MNKIRKHRHELKYEIYIFQCKIEKIHTLKVQEFSVSECRNDLTLSTSFGLSKTISTTRAVLFYYLHKMEINVEELSIQIC